MMKRFGGSKGFILGLFALTLMTAGGPRLAAANEFDRFIMPVSNPVYSGDARNTTIVRPIYIHQNLPEKVKTSAGKVDVDGTVNIFAIAASLALSERFSIVAVKDGYVDCEPDHTLNDHNGWADLAAGMQYSFIYDPEHSFILSGRLVYEAPTGSDQVFQGNGNGNINPSLLFLQGIGRMQFSGSLGFVIPLDHNEENTLFHDSWHLSYAVTDWFRPLVELNHFYVVDDGNRDAPSTGLDALGTSKEDDLVAGIATFNGCDLINLGGSNSDENRNLVTMAVGARFRVTKWMDVGAVYEFVLTDESNGLIEDRFQMDAVISVPF